MTTTLDAPVSPVSGPAPVPAVEAPAPTKRRGVPERWAYLASVLTGLAILTLGFVLIITVGSQLQNGRDQQVLYSKFREQLANAIAPVGAVSPDGVVLQPGEPVAIISIPSLGTEAVVVEGSTSAQTMLGPGHRRDTPMPGQVGVSVLLGRQAAYGGVFGGLAGLQPEELIVVTTGQGTATFRVTGLRRAGDPQPPPPAPGASRLVLTTADGDPFIPGGVLRVDADLVSTSIDGTDVSAVAFPPGPRLVGPTGLADSERAMGTDTSGAFALVLWAQLFLALVLGLTWARRRWGTWQTWVVGVPVLILVGWVIADQLALLLPNLL